MDDLQDVIWCVIVRSEDTNEAEHKKKVSITYVDNESPDETVHVCSLIRTFIFHLQNHWLL